MFSLSLQLSIDILSKERDLTKIETDLEIPLLNSFIRK